MDKIENYFEFKRKPNRKEGEIDSLNNTANTINNLANLQGRSSVMKSRYKEKNFNMQSLIRELEVATANAEILFSQATKKNTFNYTYEQDENITGGNVVTLFLTTLCSIGDITLQVTTHHDEIYCSGRIETFYEKKGSVFKTKGFHEFSKAVKEKGYSDCASLLNHSETAMYLEFTNNPTILEGFIDQHLENIKKELKEWQTNPFLTVLNKNFKNIDANPQQSILVICSYPNAVCSGFCPAAIEEVSKMINKKINERFNNRYGGLTTVVYYAQKFQGRGLNPFNMPTEEKNELINLANKPFICLKDKIFTLTTINKNNFSTFDKTYY